MKRETTPTERIAFYRQHLRGETYGEIAKQARVSVECVRYWCRKQAKGEGVESRWHVPKRGAMSQFEEEVRERILALRKEHPRWGPISIRLELERDPPVADVRLPSRDSIWRYLNSFAENRRVVKKKTLAAGRAPQGKPPALADRLQGGDQVEGRDDGANA